MNYDSNNKKDKQFVNKMQFVRGFINYVITNNVDDIHEAYKTYKRSKLNETINSKIDGRARA